MTAFTEVSWFHLARGVSRNSSHNQHEKSGLGEEEWLCVHTSRRPSSFGVCVGRLVRAPEFEPSVDVVA